MKQMKQCQKYSLLKVIGSGCFGYVFEAQNKKTHQKVALKRIEKVSNQLSREYQILLLIKDCQNVVKIKDFFYSRNDQGKLIQNIIFQFVEDNLESLIQRNIKMGTNISQKTIKNYMYQLLNGLNQIHSKNIAHRDLKPENVLLSSDDIIKICDFGSSKIIDSNGKNSPYIVSRYYRAPQLSLCITKYNTSIDIWAAGCIMAELFLLSPIFKGKSQGDQLFAIFKILGSFTDLEKKQFQLRVPFSSQVFNRFGVYERQNLQELFSMVSQKQNFIDLILKMLCYLPENRITAKEALKHPYFAEFRPQQANNYHPIVNLQDDTTEHLELKREGDD